MMGIKQQSHSSVLSSLRFLRVIVLAMKKAEVRQDFGYKLVAGD